MANNWKKKPLGSLCNGIGDGVHGTPRYVVDSPYYFINGNNLKDGKIDSTSAKRVDGDEFEKYFIDLDEKTLLMSINGTLGSLALYRGESVILGKSAAYIRCRDILREFCYYYFQLKETQRAFYNIATGSTIKNLSLDSIKNFNVPVPSLNEQTRIAAVLSALDAKIELNNRMNAELEGMAKLLYDYWFVQYDFPISEAQAKALGRPALTGHPYRASGAPMTYHPQLKREIPKGWEVGSLADLGTIVGGSTPSTKDASYFTTEGIPWITPKDLSRNTGNKFITRGETDLSEKGVKAASLTILPAGSVLMSSRAPVGYTAINRIPVTTNQGFKSFVASKAYPVEFIYYTLNHLMRVIEQNASGSTFKEVSASTLKTISTVLPDAAVLEAFQKTVSPLFQQQDNLEQQNQELSHLRDWLLPMLMNGQVRVGET